jgi:hypothetical protein
MLLLALVVMSMSKDVLHDSLEFSPVEIRLDHPVCPYTIVEADRVLQISEPLVARVYTTVMDDVSKEDIERIERPVVINPSAEGKTVDMGVNFVVPEYPPGRYAKTTAAVAEGTHAAFSTVYFEVSAICGQGESNESSQ